MTPPPAVEFGPARKLILAAGLLLLALLLQWSLRPLVGTQIPFLFFLPTVAIGAVWLGWRAASLVLAGGFAHGIWWLAPPVTRSAGMSEAAALGAYLVAAGVLLAMGSRLHRWRLRQAQAQQNLEGQLADLRGLHVQMESVTADREALREDAMALSRQVEVALESSAVPFCLFSPLRAADGHLLDFRWDYLNGAAAHLLGCEAVHVIGGSVRETLPSGWDADMLARIKTALQRDATVEFEFRSAAKGADGWFHVIASPCEGGAAVWLTDVSERKHQENALREADRRKDEFLATLSHELRNPLAPIRQAAMIARSPGVKPEQQRWSLDVIERQVGHMAVLLDDLLDVSRITRGKLELRRVVSDMRDVAESAVEAARPALEARRHRLVVGLPPAPLWAMVDPMRMAQIISNLLTNAAKYTHPEGTVQLSARPDGAEAVIEVKDDGIGIPPDALETVFEMFAQIRTPQSAGSTGLGIGLALSRGLAQMHGATLSAHSDGPGQGSTFALRVDLCDPPARATAQAAAPQQASLPRRVLVADDNRDAAQSLAEVLRLEGHEVLLAFDGLAALNQFKDQSPDVALLDIGMPHLTGNEVASAIRALPGGEAPLLVAITGWGQDRDRTAAREAGFDFHFTKPVNPRQVLRLIADPEAAKAARELQA